MRSCSCPMGGHSTMGRVAATRSRLCWIVPEEHPMMGRVVATCRRSWWMVMSAARECSSKARMMTRPKAHSLLRFCRFRAQNPVAFLGG